MMNFLRKLKTDKQKATTTKINTTASDVTGVELDLGVRIVLTAPPHDSNEVKIENNHGLRARAALHKCVPTISS